ncbi:hypothetical protein Scani_01870 [Streptomyces caniferus]|uniref:Uncharacterized protein n=1 Tax=Streptomyces caniferus TaxID=285557 RepID=A0A640RYF2_9ACTN|nr:hypothetical protein Scani_01870 [Streptomyces caniferus]
MHHLELARVGRASRDVVRAISRNQEPQNCVSLMTKHDALLMVAAVVAFASSTGSELCRTGP